MCIRELDTLKCAVAIREQDYETLYDGICIAVGFLGCMTTCGYSSSCILFVNLSSSSSEVP